MFNPANETHFSLSLEDLASDLQVLALKGHEGISRPFRFDLQRVNEDPALDLQGLLHKQAFLTCPPEQWPSRADPAHAPGCRAHPSHTSVQRLPDQPPLETR
ncbi:hypothetical protein HUT24_29735 [Pseudomonas protegens]|nr:hypothetical protein [Pseudomonas protegens]MBP5099727.1 hypothetical protein [Pseudomonas protegens]MBP5117362.1 hypothetical protein [Pseudomonas protegens]QTU04546.1 hypothetical protein HUT25_01875 [Pseudomonas protegens]QTU10856.1 hypothetical protein HUT23_02565 [Pseudomonas protegens]QTU22205.1 hypothetical protein HUT22_30060 [Pseudomonas protegens]